jgi:hypothetical protein
MAHVDLIWSGVFMSTETVMQWELDALTVAGESSPLTVRDIVERNGGEVWFQRDHAAYRAFFRFLLPAISAQDAVVTAAGVALADSRPEFYDFDLFKSEETDLALDDRVSGATGVHRVRYRNHRPRTVGGRRDHPDRRGAHRQSPPAAARGLRAADRSAAQPAAGFGEDPRHHARNAGRPAADRAGATGVPRLSSPTPSWWRTTPPSTCASWN